MSRFEEIDGTNWQEFIAAPLAVLVLAKSDCPHCHAWAEELEPWLADPGRWPEVRFGRVLLDRPGLASFKRANPWLAEVADLPFNVIYARGERVKSYPGGGIARLEARLRSVAG